MNALAIPSEAMIRKAQFPLSYKEACAALARCVKIDECKQLADKAEALSSYYAQSKDETMQRACDQIKARATRRVGELLIEVEKGHGKNKGIREGDRPNSNTRKEAAKKVGMSTHQQKTAIRVANIPEDEFKTMVEDAEKPATVTELAARGTKKRTTTTRRTVPEGVTRWQYETSGRAQKVLHTLVAEVVDKMPVDRVVKGAAPIERARMATWAKRIIAWNEALIEALDAV